MQTGLPFIPSRICRYSALVHYLPVFDSHTIPCESLQLWCKHILIRRTSRRVTCLFFVPLCLSFACKLVKGYEFHVGGSHEGSFDELVPPESHLTAPVPLLVSLPINLFPMRFYAKCFSVNSWLITISGCRFLVRTHQRLLPTLLPL
jgi:hypothetical protein